MSNVIKARFVIKEDHKYNFQGDSAKEYGKEQDAALYNTAEDIKRECQIKQKLDDEIKYQLAKTQQESKKILDEAKLEAEAIKTASLEECNKIKEEAYQAAYEEGYKKAAEQVEEDLRPLCQQTEALLNELSGAKEKYLAEQENEIIKLVVAITEKILGTIVENRPEVIAQVIKKVIVQITAAERITIKVNPLHIPYLSNYREQYPELPHDKMQIVEDPGIKPGDCVVETENGFIESKIEEQLDIIKQAILEVADHVELS